jgi:hypothetical protein
MGFITTKYYEWLNEADPKRPPLYKVGEKIMIRDSENVTVFQKNALKKLKKGWTSMVYGEIKEVDGSTGKWIYTVSMLAGTVFVRTTRSYSDEFHRQELKVPQSELTRENLREFEELYSRAKYKFGDDVSYEVNGVISTGKIVDIHVWNSIKEKQIVYEVGNKLVPEDKIEKDDISLDDASEDAVADEISRVLNVPSKKSSNVVIYDVFKYDLGSGLQGTIFFENEEKAKSFLKDLKEFFEKNADQKLQNVMNYGEPSKIKILDAIMKGTSINRSQLKDVAKTLKIDLKALLTKFRGKISGKKFGI